MATCCAAPKAGDSVHCRFPQDKVRQLGPKNRPALVIEVEEYELPDGSGEVFATVAYGTSQDADDCHPGEFKIESDDPHAGLSFDTKFDLGNLIKLPFDDQWFTPSPNRLFGNHPKRGVVNTADDTLERRLSSAVAELKRAARPKAVDMTVRSIGRKKRRP